MAQGVIGIENHGNTCFINAVVQCLRHTDVLAEYLTLKHYKSDLEFKRRQDAKRNRWYTEASRLAHNTTLRGSLRRRADESVAESDLVVDRIATLVHDIWSHSYNQKTSLQFKRTLERQSGGGQYRGSSQHDAQEFLLWLLDCLHRELMTCKPRLEPDRWPSKQGGSLFQSEQFSRYMRTLFVHAREEAMALKMYKFSESGDSSCMAERDDAWHSLLSYMKATKSGVSLITDLFQAQFRSAIACPACSRQSTTFDPFVSISLPIAKPLPVHSKPTKLTTTGESVDPAIQQPIYVVVVYLNHSPRLVRLGLALTDVEALAVYYDDDGQQIDPNRGRVGELRSKLAVDTGIARDQMILTEIDCIGQQRVLCDDEPLNSIKSVVGGNVGKSSAVVSHPDDQVRTPVPSETTGMTSGCRKRKSIVLLDDDEIKKRYPTTLYCIETPENKSGHVEEQSESICESDSDVDAAAILEYPTGDAGEVPGSYVLLTWVNVFKAEGVRPSFDVQSGGPEGPMSVAGDVKRREIMCVHRFGSPYNMLVSRDVLYVDLQKLMLKTMAPILHDDILISQQRVPLFKIKFANKSNVDQDQRPTLLDSHVELPLYTECVEEALVEALREHKSSADRFSGPIHLPLVLEWDMPAKSQVINVDSDDVEDHASVTELAEIYANHRRLLVDLGTAVPPAGDWKRSTTLQSCFQLYTSAERLVMPTAGGYLCSSCHNRSDAVVKRMTLWNLPDILVVHLKRFRHSCDGSVTQKLSTLVQFPLKGLDMGPHVVCGHLRDACCTNRILMSPKMSTAAANSHQRRAKHMSLPNTKPTSPQLAKSATLHNHETLSSETVRAARISDRMRSWLRDATYRRVKKSVVDAACQQLEEHVNSDRDQACDGDSETDRSASDGFLYDLYAVCNHHGTSLESGHYTAVCRHPVTAEWYRYDDAKTEKVEDGASVVTADAYILFYARRSATAESRHVHGDVGEAHHWISRLTSGDVPIDAQVKPPLPAQSSDELMDIKLTAKSS